MKKALYIHAPTKAQRGVALILVLGLMAIITILATTITGTVQFSANQHVTLKDMRQAYWFARGGEVYALSTLADLKEKSLLEATDTQVTFPLSGDGHTGMVSYQLTPLHTCLNINSLDITFENPDARSLLNKNVWTYFLENKAQISGATITQLLQRAADWIDPDTQPKTPYGAESLFYSGQTPPQQPPNSTMLASAELGALDVLNEDEQQAIRPFLCIRPDDNTLAINPNDLTADDAYLLSVLTQGQLDENQALSVIESRPDDGYAELAAFWADPALSEVDDSVEASFTLARHYFKLDTQVVLGTAPFRLISLLRIDEDDTTHVISRRYGVTP